MRALLSALTALTLVSLTSTAGASPPDTLWARYIGTSTIDYGYSVKQTPDGGFIATGVTYSSGNGDVYLLKVSAAGDSMWSRTYGGPEEDIGRCVWVCRDGGYIIAGDTDSYGAGLTDLYLIRTNACGDTLWTRAYGGSSTDHGRSVIQTDEGGFLAVGSAGSWHTRYEAWLVKTDADGDSVWTRRYHTYNNTHAYEVVENTFGGETYAVAGYGRWGTEYDDFYLIKTEQDGDTLWTRVYGSTRWEFAEGLDLTSDHGYVVAGYSSSFGAAYYDFLVARVDAGGDSLWQRLYYRLGYEYARSVRETPDGGYIVAGETNWGTHGGNDVYLIKLDARGDTLWTRVYGSASHDTAYEVQVTSDGGYIIGGYGYDYAGGGYDFYLIRLGADASVGPGGRPLQRLKVDISPNPFTSSVGISYVLARPASVQADIYDVAGRHVCALASGVAQEAGRRSLVWEGRDGEGAALPAGIYFLSLHAGDARAVEKIVLVQ
jgi:hypothetical protein